MFQTRKELETIFSTEAAFYKLQTGERSHLCRSLAAIRRKGFQEDRVDALFVLLNPGKCLPEDGEDSVLFLTGLAESVTLVPANPDNTMYQLMRLMERMNWDHVQIINLTDLRTGKFDEFKESQKFMAENGDSRHSIFSMDRYSELLDCVERADALIAGWGTKLSITQISLNAWTILSELGTVNGLSYRSHPLYYHPFPWIQGKCIQWLDDMEEQLKEAAHIV